MFIISTLVSATIVCADVRIEQVLPDNTIAVFSINDVSTLANHLKDTGVCDVMCELGQELTSNTPEDACPFLSTECIAFIESLELDEAELMFPTGPAGGGIYPVVDYETGQVGIGMLAMIQVEGTPFDAIGDSFANHFEDGIESVDLSGREVWLMTDYLPTDLPDTGPFDISSLSHMYFANSDGYLIIGTEPDCFARALAAIDGEPEEDSLANTDVFSIMMDRCGEGGDIHAAVMLENLADVIVQMDHSGISMMFLPMLKSTIGDIDGIAETVNFAPSDDVMLQGKYTLYMGDGRNGLMGLIGSNSSQVPIPNFVSADTITYSQGTIDFDKLVPLVKEIIDSNPMLAIQMGPQQIVQMELGFQNALAPLGSKIHFISSGRLPFASDSMGYLVAVECKNEEQFSTVLTSLMPVADATTTDFLGNQIFTVEFGGSMMMPIPLDMSISFAVAGGYAFCGLTHSVENALRSIANPKESKSDHGTNTAVELIDHADVSGWGYGDIQKSLEIQSVMNSQIQESMLADIEEFDPEMAAEMRDEFAEGQQYQKMLLKSMSLLFGPMAWNLSTSETGITSEVIMMRN